jgi:hypothetical protein
MSSEKFPRLLKISLQHLPTIFNLFVSPLHILNPPPNHQLQPHPTHTIATDSDLIIILEKHERIYPRPETGPPTKTVTVAKFKVKRSTLSNLPYSNNTRDGYFKCLLTGSFLEARRTTFTIGDDDYAALKVFLSIVHEVPLLDVSHKVMWPLLMLFNKYNVDLQPLAEKWFAAWYEARGDKIKDIPAQEMLYPCYKFNHAEGFYKASGHCIYNVAGHITEHNPTKFRNFHLHPRIIRKSHQGPVRFNH